MTRGQSLAPSVWCDDSQAVRVPENEGIQRPRNNQVARGVER